MVDVSEKQKQLADLIHVDPDKLMGLKNSTCTRIINAIEYESFYLSRFGLTFASLMRTPRIGRDSAVRLCNALNIPLTYRVSDEHEEHLVMQLARKLINHAQYDIESRETIVISTPNARYRLNVERLLPT